MPPMVKVTSGSALSLRSDSFNTLADVVNAYKRGGRGSRRTSLRELRQTGIVLVRNDSGSDRDRFDVLGVDGPLIEPVDNALEFQGHVVALKGVVPSATHVGRFVVLLEPLLNGVIGRGFIDGVSPARVEMVDETHAYADVKPGDPTLLQSASTGLARLLWIEPEGDRVDPDIAWTIVRMGGSGAGAARFAIITSVAGATPPYRYSAEDATMDVDGAWSAVAGGAAYNNVFNLEEQGAGGQWVNPLLVGDVVAIFAPPDPSVDAWVCSRSHYRGTY